MLQTLRMLRLLGTRHDERARTDLQGEQRWDPLRGLVAGALNGHPEAERTLTIALGPTLLRVVRGALGVDHPDVEDVLQDTMIALHSAWPSFRGDCSTTHFACRIAIRSTRNARRRAEFRVRRSCSSLDEQGDYVPVDESSPAEQLAAARRRRALRRLLDELPEVQAEVLALHIMLGYTVEETARAAGVPIDTVRSRLRSALSALRTRVQSDGALLDIVKGGV